MAVQPFDTVRYAKTNEAKIYGFNPDTLQRNTKVVNRMLMGTYLKVTHRDNNYLKVITAGEDGWIKEDDTTTDMGLKVFFLDVGQGDGALLEIGDRRILIDGGPASNMHKYLKLWQYSYLIRENKPVFIDDIFISHFDADHYEGLTDILDDTNFRFGKIYHNGIAKFNKSKLVSPYNDGLGSTFNDPLPNGPKFLKATFDSLDDLVAVQQLGCLQESPFVQFVTAATKAKQDGRLTGGFVRLKRDDNQPFLIQETIEGKPFSIEVLGPICTPTGDFAYLRDPRNSYSDSHTVNGHSLVLKVSFGTCSILFGGDLNIPAEERLLNHFQGHEHVFDVDVAKSCHHGASEFTTDFMKAVNPYATVISSGDNEQYSHPRADAIGCAGRYSKGNRPVVFSTELARSVNKAGDILFGMINLRCNGNEIYMAQMKEVKKKDDVWDSYQIKPPIE